MVLDFLNYDGPEVPSIPYLRNKKRSKFFKKRSRNNKKRFKKIRKQIINYFFVLMFLKKGSKNF